MFFWALFIVPLWVSPESLNPHYDDSIEFKFKDFEFDDSTLYIKEGSSSVLRFGSDEWCLIPDSVEYTTDKYLRMSPSIIADVLTNHLCSSSNMGYWIFEVCHGMRVRQYHLGGDGKLKRERLNYLGYFAEQADVPPVTKYDIRTLRQFERSNFFPEIFVLVNYTQGEVCPSLNLSRHALVYYVCAPREELRIISIKEIDRCGYEIVVGVPDLCPHQKTRREVESLNVLKCFKDNLPEKEESDSIISLETILKVIDKKFESQKARVHVVNYTKTVKGRDLKRDFFNGMFCMKSHWAEIKHDFTTDGWVYEFCYRGEIRQEHRTSEGQIIKYSLGRHDSSFEDMMEDHPEDGTVVVQQYFDGTRCDGRNFNRSTTVWMQCAPTWDPSTYNMVVSEYDTCLYTIKVTSRIFC